MNAIEPLCRLACLDAALEYAARGWHVFPVPPGEKKSYKSAEHSGGRKWGATTDQDEIRRDWHRWPNANVGIVTGPKSGLFVIEADTAEGHGVDGIGNLVQLIEAHGPIPDTIEALSPSGSWHVFFRWPEAGGVANSAGQIAPGVDVRGDGGMVVAAPSMKPGAPLPYRWQNPPGFFDLADCPEWLLAIARKPAQRPPSGPSFQILTGADAFSDDIASAAEVSEILGHIPATCGYDDWLTVLMGLHEHFGGSATGLALADGWSATGGVKYRPGEVAAKWASFAGGGVSWSSVCEIARRHGADLSRIARRHKGGDAARQSKSHEAEGEPERASRFMPASDLHGRPIPPRPWHVEGMIPGRNVTIFNGDGGVGKSLLNLQLACSTALGRLWLGREVAAGDALFITAEDELAELHRRLADIVHAEGVTLADLRRLTIRSLAGEDALLARSDGRSGLLLASELYHELERFLADTKPALVVLDTLADLFPGNENDRAQARQFIGLLRGLAIRHGCAIVLLAHPSLSGMSNGSGSSGSTGWNNSARSRLYLERVKSEGYEADPDARVLRGVKNNHGRTGDEIALRWQDGVFVAEAEETGLDRMAAASKAERVFLKVLREFAVEGRQVSPKTGHGYAPAVFAKSGRAEGCTKAALNAAMETLFAKGAIRIEASGPPSRPVNRIVEAG